MSCTEFPYSSNVKPLYIRGKMEIKELHKKSSVKMAPEKFEELVKKMRKEHEKPIKGMFEFTDAGNGWLDFCYRFFKDDPIYTIRLTHGEICELPMGIVKHLNNTYKKVRTMLPNLDQNGNRGIPSTVERTSRVRFTSVEVL